MDCMENSVGKELAEGYGFELQVCGAVYRVRKCFFRFLSPFPFRAHQL